MNIGVFLVPWQHENMFQSVPCAFEMATAVVRCFWTSKSEWPTAGSECHLILDHLTFKRGLLDIARSTQNSELSQCFAEGHSSARNDVFVNSQAVLPERVYAVFSDLWSFNSSDASQSCRQLGRRADA